MARIKYYDKASGTWKYADEGYGLALDTTLGKTGQAAESASVGLALEKKLNNSGFNPNKVLGTDRSGNVVEKDEPIGVPGKDGISPVVSVSPIEGGNKITITDKNGEKNVNVMDGKMGESGGYYEPKVTQPTENTMKIEYTPIDPSMGAVQPVTINLPTGASDAVRYGVQELEPSQKEQALKNIGAMPKNVGAENSGKTMVVSSNGDILPGESTQQEVVNVDAEMKQYMNVVKPEIAAAITEKGGSASVQDAFGTFPDKIRAIPNGVGPMEDLPKQSALNAEETTENIVLRWQDTGAVGYVIVKKENIAPKNPSDGEEIYRGDLLTYSDPIVKRNVKVFYRIYPYNSKMQYQAYPGNSIVEMNIIDRTEQKKLGDLNLEDEVIFGEFEGHPLRWKIKDTVEAKREGIVALGASSALFSNAFDAPENDPENPNPNGQRKSYGNNRWSVSNIRQWLNSNGEPNTWFVPAHKYDVCAGYKSKAGFMKSFNEYETGLILEKKNKCFLPDADGGGFETVFDKIWLISESEAGLSLSRIEGTHVFNGMETSEQRKFESNYWTRTIHATDNPNGVRYVLSSGGSNSGGANNGGAARPFCQLAAGTYVRWSAELSAYIFADDSQRYPIA